VTGGTNTGKSLVFNHLAGEPFSAVDHRASGTKHPVCLVPKQDTSFEPVLTRHFDSFRCIPWSNAEQSLNPADENQLFWLEGKNVPERLMLLDTPDFDTDRERNWDRAKAVRHAADVVIAVLTEQKYNDAAVRLFFREAAEADKPMIVLFNMLEMDSDMPHIARWLEQFQKETGAKPMAVLAAPFDKEQAEKIELPFYAIRENKPVPVDLKTELNELHFDTIKTQTLLGAVKILDDPKTGVRSYLDSVQRTSERFAEALKTLENIGDTEVQWSGLPSAMLADEIRNWWNSGRPALSQKINNFYRTIGTGLLFPVRKAANYFTGNRNDDSQITSLDDFRSAEHRAVIELVGKMMGKLETLADADNPVLRREILELTSGEHRVLLLQRAHRVLDTMPPVDEDFRHVLRQRLTEWTAKNPKKTAWIQTLDHAATAARPIITVTLAVGGFWAAGAYVVSHMVVDAVMASGITAGGEAAIHAGSEGITGGAAHLFRQIQEDYVLLRSKKFSDEFQKELWRDVMSRLQTGATITETDAFKRCRNWKV
jgi:hypothetical protein